MEHRKIQDTKHLSVGRLPRSGKWYGYNSVLKDSYMTDSQGEMTDLILDNTSLSIDEVRGILALMLDGTVTRIEFKLMTEADYEDSYYDEDGQFQLKGDR